MSYSNKDWGDPIHSAFSVNTNQDVIHIDNAIPTSSANPPVSSQVLKLPNSPH